MSITKMYDLVVVGSGWYGLAAAKAYLQDHPDAQLLVIEAESTAGGTWSRDRLYPGLKSNNLWGSYEFPDFPMRESVYGIGEGQHIPAEVLHRYLTDFSKEFGIFENTIFDTKVTVIEAMPDDTFKISTTSSKKPGTRDSVVSTARLVMATGLTSEPNLPEYPGQETFKGHFMHAKSFCTHGDTINTCKRAVVVGGGKSAFDCAYAFATSPANEVVDLLIRPDGDGPVWLAPPYVTPFKRKIEGLLCTRALTWMSPAPWGDEDGYGWIRSFLHGTAVGNFLVGAFWKVLAADVVGAHGFNKDPELFKLKPWQSPMWTGSGVSIHNFQTSLMDLVRSGKIRVHIADITRLDGRTVHLSTGEALEGTDMVMCATGWKKESALRYVNFDQGLRATGPEREKMVAQADAAITSTYPMLADQPVLRRPLPTGEPLRNYRFIVPSQSVAKRNFAHAGMVSTVFTSTFAAVQGLWISAFFDGKLARPPPADEAAVAREVVLHTQFGRWRYPCGYGASLPDFAFDSIPYLDLLLNDLGISPHRKPTRVWEMLDAYQPKDYRGISEEWRVKRAAMGKA